MRWQGLEKIRKRGEGERGDLDFCFSQTPCKLTAGHPQLHQGGRLSISLGHIETGLQWRGRSELSA